LATGTCPWGGFPLLPQETAASAANKATGKISARRGGKVGVERAFQSQTNFFDNINETE